MVANLILLCSLETYLSFEIWKHLLESRGYLIHLFFFSGGHLSTHCFGYLGHFCVHFFSSLFFSFLSLFLNNFCIAHASFLQWNLREIATRTWSIYLVDRKPNKHVFVFTLSVGVEYFWVDLNGRHVFMPTPNIGVVHIWVVCT